VVHQPPELLHAFRIGGKLRLQIGDVLPPIADRPGTAQE